MSMSPQVSGSLSPSPILWPAAHHWLSLELAGCSGDDDEEVEEGPLIPFGLKINKSQSFKRAQVKGTENERGERALTWPATSNDVAAAAAATDRLGLWLGATFQVQTGSGRNASERRRCDRALWLRGRPESVCVCMWLAVVADHFSLSLLLVCVYE